LFLGFSKNAIFDELMMKFVIEGNTLFKLIFRAAEKAPPAPS
jgi:hypothetical protein